MNDTKALVARLRTDRIGVMQSLGEQAADALEALQSDLAKHRELLVYHLSVIDPLRAELAAMKGDRTFAGWFTELDSAMSYRLWEQGGCEPGPGDVALYAASGAKP